MDEQYDICIRSPYLIKKEIFLCWLDGKTVQETTIIISKNNNNKNNSNSLIFRPRNKGSINIENELNKLLYNEVNDQYKLYLLLQHYFHRPSRFVNPGN